MLIKLKKNIFTLIFLSTARNIISNFSFSFNFHHQENRRQFPNITLLKVLTGRKSVSSTPTRKAPFLIIWLHHKSLRLAECRK